MTDEGVSFCKYHKCIVEDCNESICPALNIITYMKTSGNITGVIKYYGCRRGAPKDGLSTIYYLKAIGL